MDLCNRYTAAGNNLPDLARIIGNIVNVCYQTPHDIFFFFFFNKSDMENNN